MHYCADRLTINTIDTGVNLYVTKLLEDLLLQQDKIILILTIIKYIVFMIILYIVILTFIYLILRF